MFVFLMEREIIQIGFEWKKVIYETQQSCNVTVVSSLTEGTASLVYD